MTTSGTHTFNMTFDKIINRAFARCGRSLRTGYDLTSARDNLNLLFSEWSNRGIHLWRVKNATTNVVSGTTTYTIPDNGYDVLEAVYRRGSTANTTSKSDTTMTQISRSEYEAIPNKLALGTPSQYYVRRNLSNVEINLYLTPNITDDQINYFYVARIEDVGKYTNTPDAPYRFLPCLVSGLAYYMSQEIAPERADILERRYEQELNRALIEDSQSTSISLTPMNNYPFGG